MTENTEKISQFDKDPVTPKEVFGYNMGAVPGAFLDNNNASCPNNDNFSIVIY